MKKAIGIVAFLALSFSGFGQETAETVIEKYIKAVGGKDAIAQIQDISISSMSETPRGVSETEIKYKTPNRFRMTIYSNGMELMKSVYDGTKFQRSGMMNNGQTTTKEGKEAWQEAMQMAMFPELNYAELGVKQTLAGTEKVGESEATRIDFELAERKWSNFYDNATGLKVKQISAGRSPRGDFQSVAVLSDYKEHNGIKIPMSRTQTSPMGEIKSEVQSVKINKGLKDKDFVVD